MTATQETTPKQDRWISVRRQILAEHAKTLKADDLPAELPTTYLASGELNASDHFTGRGQLLEEVAECIRNTESLNIYALNGIGGIGKSELAKQVALKLEKEDAFPDGYLWISLNGVERDSVPLRIAEKFGIINLGEVQTLGAQIEILKKVFAITSPLIVLDNADEPEVFAVASEILRGQTVLTTSRAPLSGVSRARDIDDLAPEDGAELFWRIYSAKAAVDEAKDRNEAELSALVQLLSGHPLTLQTFASKAARSKQPVANLLKQLNKLRKDQKGLLEGVGGDDSAETRHRDIKRTLGLVFEDGLGGLHITEKRLRTFFSACAALGGEYFYVEEVTEILLRYRQLYYSAKQAAEDRRAERGQRGSSGVMEALGLADGPGTVAVETESDPEEDKDLVDEPDAKGVSEVDQLLRGLPPVLEVLELFVDICLVQRFMVKGDDRTRYRFH
ncbi:MAG: NB-ARC domain-containing protein, partial [Acidobacteriota bacterium]